MFITKRITIIILIFNIGVYVISQKNDYHTKLNIPYYNDSINRGDKYISERCLLDLYYPKNSKSFATIIWFHGGGLTSGNKEFPGGLMEKGIGIISVNYRLYPKIKSPEYIKDAAASIAWVFKNIVKYGGDTSLVFVSGHSAGAYLCLMATLDKKWLSAYGIDANKIAGIIPLSGQTITHFIIRKERGIPDTQPVIDSLAPLYHVRADAPPIVLITGDRELEMLGRYEENAYLMRMMKIAGHKNTILYELDGYGHDMTEPAFPLLIHAVGRICKEIGSGKE